MKNFKTLLIAVTLILGASSFANAQSKVAHIATQELVPEMPAYKDAMAQLEKLQKTYQADIQEMAKAAETAVTQFREEAPNKTEEENQKKLMELQQTDQNINAYRQNAYQELDKKRVELLQPIMERAHKVIQEVAREKGYDYVLDSSTGTGVLMADGYNLMEDVKKALGI